MKSLREQQDAFLHNDDSPEKEEHTTLFKQANSARSLLKAREKDKSKSELKLTFL